MYSESNDKVSTLNQQIEIIWNKWCWDNWLTMGENSYISASYHLSEKVLEELKS